MSPLTHLADADAAWAEAMLADWSNEECGRHVSSDYMQREGCTSEARDWVRHMDPEQTAVNEGMCIYFADADPPPAPLGAKRPSP